MKRTKVPLDTYEMFIMPKEQVAYLSNYGFHFNKAAYEYAAKMMYKKDKQTGKEEKLQTVTKEDVDNLLKRFNVDVENKDSYDYVYVAQMCKADFYGSSVADEHRWAFFIKDYMDDADQADGFVFRRWIADMTGKGEAIDWISFLV